MPNLFTNFIAFFSPQNLLAVFLMLGILSILIIVHEFGHFSVARFFGFQTPVFGIGLPFGPSWVVGTKWGTQFKIHALLLGGYVAIPELGDESSMAHDAYGVPLKPFTKFPIWQRALVAVAGVTMNVIFAYVVMVALVAMLGVPVEKVYVEDLPAGVAIAREAGVKVGDRIDTLDGNKITKTDQVIEYLSSHKSTQVTLGILREPEDLKGTSEGEAKAEKVEIKATTSPAGKLGMALGSPRVKQEMNPIAVCADAFSELCDLTYQMMSTLCKMIYQIVYNLVTLQFLQPKAATGPPQAGLGDLHGVLVVIKWGAELAQQDWTKLFTFTALISMDLAIVNLLPIPALDGGHLFFMLMEAIRGKPMDEKLHGELVKWGFISLLALMALIMVNDIRALMTGELDFKKDKKNQKQQVDKAPDGSSKAEPEKAKPETDAVTDPEPDPEPDKSSKKADPPALPAEPPPGDPEKEPVKEPAGAAR